ncbi:hypothetical protein CsSME_00014535 [Camellia sinensis var. sinensis]
MDFHSMKREELQALCKKHKIPANLTNLEMANKLSSLLEEKEKPNRRGQSCLNLKNKGEIVSENDSNGITRQFKKVRLSPENEMVDFVDMEAEPVEIKRVENPSLIEGVISLVSPIIEKRMRNCKRSDIVEVTDCSRAPDCAAVEEIGVPTRRSLRN